MKSTIKPTPLKTRVTTFEIPLKENTRQYSLNPAADFLNGKKIKKISNLSGIGLYSPNNRLSMDTISASGSGIMLNLKNKDNKEILSAPVNYLLGLKGYNLLHVPVIIDDKIDFNNSSLTLPDVVITGYGSFLSQYSIVFVVEYYTQD